MSRRILLLCAVLLGLGLAVALVVTLTTREERLPVAYVRPFGEQPTEPMCPWREPEQDMRRYFPGATAHEPVAWILSAGRLELTKLLGRHPRPEEYVLHANRILAGDREVGLVIPHRVKGSAGAMELVIALNPDDSVRAVAFQRMREPEPIAAALKSPAWLRSFQGLGSRKAQKVPTAPAAAKEPGQAVLDVVQTTLAMVSVARAKGVLETGEGAEPHH